LIQAHLEGAVDNQPGALTLAQALKDCAHIAAALHKVEIKLGQPRTIEVEWASLQNDMQPIQEFSLALAMQLQKVIKQVQEYATQTKPLPIGFGHGDFTYTQLIFADTWCGLVDFDTSCEAEPALDLGQFLAYVRLAVRKAERHTTNVAELAADELCNQFLNAYMQIAGYHGPAAEQLRARVAVYEIISLLRIAQHSWQKMKGSRLEIVIDLLEERVTCLPLIVQPVNVQSNQAFNQKKISAVLVAKGAHPMFTVNHSATEYTASPVVTVEKSSTDLTGQLRFTPPSWLTAAITSEQICQGLRRQVAEFAVGQLVVRSCAIKRLRFRKNLGVWNGTFILTIEGLRPGAGQPQVVTLQGTLLPPGIVEPLASNNDYPFGADQWRCYLPELHLELRTQQPDTELAMMPQLIDPEQARSLLEASIRNGGSAARQDLHIQACQPRVARYKPGSRCTILYHLEYQPTLAQTQQGPSVVVAKTYQDDLGQNAYTSMQALWQSPLGASRTVTIAEPLAYLPDLNVLVQGPIREEMTLKELIRHTLRKAERNLDPGAPLVDPELASYICKTAAGLAELHQCGVHYGEQVVWEDELAEIYEHRTRLAKPLPQLATMAEDLLNRLQTLAALHPADPLAPAHRSFRPAQVLLAAGEIGFIDFDGFCQAEPALDIALFMATIKNLRVNKSSVEDEDEEAGETMDTQMNAETRLARLIQADAICELFLTEYEKHAPVSRPRIVLWETLDLLSLVLSSWTKLKLARLDTCLFMLERHLVANEEIMTG